MKGLYQIDFDTAPFNFCRGNITVIMLAHTKRPFKSNDLKGLYLK
jgi:hypothetical protein